MYKELEKYRTGNKTDMDGILPDGQIIKIKGDEYIFKLGDVMSDFIKHQNKPRWKRKYYHDHLTSLYIKILNEVNIKYAF